MPGLKAFIRMMMLVIVFIRKAEFEDGQQFNLVNTNQIALGSSFEPQYLLTKYEKTNKVICLFKCKKTYSCVYSMLYRTGNNQVTCILANETLALYLVPTNAQTDVCINDFDLQEFQVFKKKKYMN